MGIGATKLSLDLKDWTKKCRSSRLCGERRKERRSVDGTLAWRERQMGKIMCGYKGMRVRGNM